MALLDLLWWALTLPAGLMPFAWPVFLGLPIANAVLALAMAVIVRRLAVRRGGTTRLSPAAAHPVRIALAVGGGTFVAAWLMVSLAALILVVAAGIRA